MTDATTWPDLLSALLAGRDLSVSEATWAMGRVMAGDSSPSQLAGFLVALRAKGETVDEVVGFRDAILDAALPLDIDPDALDIYAVADRLWKRGWYVDKQGPPPSLHLTVNAVHDGKIAAFLADLDAAIAEVVAVATTGVQGAYGTVE